MGFMCFFKISLKKGHLCDKTMAFFCLKAPNALLFRDINFLKRVKYEYIQIFT